MTTNKASGYVVPFLIMIYLSEKQRKAVNFYANANVKNKSRTKAALMKSLAVGKKAR